MEVIKLFDIPKEVINDNERQRRVYSVEGISPTILGRSDACKIMEVKQLGNIYGFTGGSYAGLVYDKNFLAPSLNAMQGGNRQPMIIDKQIPISTSGKVIDTASTILAGYERTNMTGFNADNGVWCIGGLQEHQTPRTDGISPSLTAAMGMGGGQTPLTNHNYRIRKLTPKECWRLMGFTDTDFMKAEMVNSNTQLYKQAGNSIVKDVLMAIFKEMM